MSNARPDPVLHVLQGLTPHKIKGARLNLIIRTPTQYLGPSARLRFAVR